MLSELEMANAKDDPVIEYCQQRQTVTLKWLGHEATRIVFDDLFKEVFNFAGIYVELTNYNGSFTLKTPVGVRLVNTRKTY